MGAPVEVPINIAAYLHPGDTVPIHIRQLDMSSNFRIDKIEKKESAATLTFESPTDIATSILSKIKAGNTQQIADRAGVKFTRSLASDAPTSPAGGDVWYKTDAGTYWYYDAVGAAWTQFTPV